MANTAKTVELHRVVITGTGAITPAGAGVEVLWDKLLTGETAITHLPDEVREKFGIHCAGIIPNYDPLEFGFTKKESRRFARFVQYAMIASDEAMAQANIDMEQEDPTRFACIFGSGIGSLDICEKESITMHERGPKRVSPLFIPSIIANMAAGNLSIRYGLKGDCTCLVTACATGSHSIGEAYRLIRYGLADAALCGGTEYGTVDLSLAGFGNLGALSKEQDNTIASRPFDVDRSGFVAADGAGALVIESLEHAKARGAHIIAEITGFGSTGDAYHMTAPDPTGDGAVRSMKQALDEGGFKPEDIGHLNAHGTSTHANDAMESAALYALAGDCASKIPVTSIKGCTGHMLGGAGAVEAIICALSVNRGIIPPTAGHKTIDPECNVFVPTEPIEVPNQKVALSNSLGFGGHNATLAISPFNE